MYPTSQIPPSQVQDVSKRQLPLSDLMERMAMCMEEYFERQEGQVQGWCGV